MMIFKNSPVKFALVVAAVFILTLCLYSSPVWAADPDLPPVGQEEGEDTGEAVNPEVSLTFSDTLEEEKGTEEPGGDTPALDPETADDAAPEPGDTDEYADEAGEGEDVGGNESGGDTPAPNPETADNTTIETGDEESLTDDCASEEGDEAMPAFFALQSTDEPYFFNDPEEDLVIVTSIERMGFDITIIAKTITVEPDVIISTQYLVNGVTSGNSGHITFIARVITLKERVQLLTCVTDDLYTAGNITLQAESGVDQYIDDAEARIEINSGSGIKGKDIKITARAHALRPEQEMDEDLDFNDVVVRVLEDLLTNPGDALTLFAVQKDALARITIADFVTIIAGNDLTISAESKADATINTGFTVLSAGYSRADAAAEVKISGAELKAGGDILVNSTAAATADVEAKTKDDMGPLPDAVKTAINLLSAAFAMADTDLVSLVEITGGTSMESAGGNINIQALGVSENSATAQAGMYDEGVFGAAVALSFKKSDVRAEVDAFLTAAGRSLDPEDEEKGLTQGVGILARLESRDTAVAKASREVGMTTMMKTETASRPCPAKTAMHLLPPLKDCSWIRSSDTSPACSPKRGKMRTPKAWAWMNISPWRELQPTSRRPTRQRPW